MNRPQGPDATALGQSPHQALQRMKQQENRLESSLDASRYAQGQGMADLARAQNAESNTAGHRWLTQAHADAAAQLETGSDPRLQILKAAKDVARHNLGLSSVNEVASMAGAVRPV